LPMAVARFRFNSTLVRFKQLLGGLVEGVRQGFNSTLVRFKQMALSMARRRI